MHVAHAVRGVCDLRVVCSKIVLDAERVSAITRLGIHKPIKQESMSGRDITKCVPNYRIACWCGVTSRDERPNSKDWSKD